MDAIHRTRHGTRADLHHAGRAPGFTKQEQLKDSSVVLFITKYGGDADESSTGWLNEQLELVSNVRSWKVEGIIKYVNAHKEQWRRSSPT